VKVAAPGKLILTGAYAVLEGAPAIVVAVDRCAIADSARVAETPAAEVRAAMGGRAPYVDASSLYAPTAEGVTKLGLGSSAAVLVASLGVRAAERGADLRTDDTRARLLSEARAAHAVVQSGGSGVDVAASVLGGVLRYELVGGDARATRVDLPRGLEIACFWSGTSARTSDLRARVDALRTRDRALYAARMRDLARASRDASDACGSSTLSRFLVAARSFGAALAALGAAADAPIVTPTFAQLAACAADDGAAFFPSGAGGGDVCIHLGASAPTESFHHLATSLGMRALPIAIDRDGVRVVD
jgi:phosphomevalonate kinase